MDHCNKQLTCWSCCKLICAGCCCCCCGTGCGGWAVMMICCGTDNCAGCGWAGSWCTMMFWVADDCCCGGCWAGCNAAISCCCRVLLPSCTYQQSACPITNSFLVIIFFFTDLFQLQFACLIHIWCQITFWRHFSMLTSDVLTYGTANCHISEMLTYHTVSSGGH